MADNEQNSHPAPKPDPGDVDALGLPEAAPVVDSRGADVETERRLSAQLATPLETALANVQALENQVAQAAQVLNNMRIQLLKWQGAAEFLASLEHGDGPSNGEDKEKTLADALHKETSQ